MRGADKNTIDQLKIMNIFASIIDQRLASVIESIQQQAAEELGIREAGRLKSLAFVYLCDELPHLIGGGGF